MNIGRQFFSLFFALTLSGTAGIGCGDGETKKSVCDHGIPNATTGACTCEFGYEGEKCDVCIDTWQDRDGDGQCTPDCGPHGVNAENWSVFDMSTACDCEPGYDGERCDTCANGWQDKDGDGQCAPDCKTAELICPEDKICSDDSGIATCETPAIEWTFLVYLDGDNDLGFAEQKMNQFTDFATEDLEEMIRAMAANPKGAKQINLIVLFDQSRYSKDSSTRVYRITSEKAEVISTGYDIFSGSEANMADAKILRNFGVWAVKNYPAKKYALLLWDHGGGWKGVGDESVLGGDSLELKEIVRRCGSGFAGLRASTNSDANADVEFSSSPAFREFSVDETSNDYRGITLSDGTYRKALEAIAKQANKKLNLVAFDACLMGMFEVAKETAEVADYLVASEESVPGAGFNYDDLLTRLLKVPTMDSAQFARTITDSYGDSGIINGGGRKKYRINATMASYNLAKIGGLTDALDNFGTTLADVIAADSQHKNAIAAIGEKVQRFAYNEHMDLHHFATLVKAEAFKSDGKLPEVLVEPADALLDALNDVVIHARHNNCSEIWDGRTHDDAYGMALFFPQNVDCNYFEGMSMTYTPCVTFPEEPPQNGTGNYTKLQVKDYSNKKEWSQGWRKFLKVYHNL